MSAGKKLVEWGGKFIDEISGPAAEAADALDTLRESMASDREEMAALRKAMQSLKGGGDATKAMVKDLRQQLEGKRITLAKNQAEYIKLGGSLKQIKPQAKDLKSAFAELNAGLKQMPGPIGQFYSTITRLIERIPKARAAVVLLGLAMVGVASAVAVASKHLVEHAIAAQNARRNELLLLEAHTRVRNLWGFPPGKSADMQKSLDRIAPTVSIARGELAQLQMQLYQGGLRAKTLDTVLEAAAIKQSALGSAAGSAFAGFATAVHYAGGSVNRMAQDIKNRFGDVVQRQMKSLEVQALKTKEAYDSMFSDVDIEPFLTANKRLNDIFTQNTAAGKALKAMITSWVQPLMNGITSVMVWWRRFVKQIIIGVTEIEIAWLTLRNAGKRAFGWIPDSENVLTRFFKAVSWGRVVVYVLAAAMLKLAITTAIAVWPWLLFAAAVWGAFEIITQVWDLLMEIDWQDVGRNIINGIVEPIIKAEDWVVKQVKDLATAMTGAFKSALGIQSPSKVFAELGLQIPAGVRQGIEQGSPAANAAAAKTVTPPNAPTVAPVDAGNAKPAAPSRGDVSITIQQVTVSAGSGEPKAMATAFRRELESVLQGLAVQIGAGV